VSVNTEDVAEGLAAMWNAAGGLPALILGRVALPTAAPYTSARITDGPKTNTATGGYLQSFGIELKTWDEAGAAAAGTVKAAIEAALTKTGRTVLALPSGRTLQILSCLKDDGGGGTLDDDEATQRAQAVKVSTDRFAMLCQA